MVQECLTNDQVLHGMRILVRQGKIKWTVHAEERMAERGYERGQVKQCLLSGSFIEPPHIPNRAGDVQYVFKMHANIDSEAIDVVASWVPEKKVVVISVIDPNSQT